MKLPLLYLLLVGLPVVGLLAVLRAGEGIEAPPSVNGTWRVTEGARCSIPDSLFRIEQSGTFLHVSMPGRADLPARLDGHTLIADGGARADVSPGCASDPVQIRVQADGRVAEQLVGTIGIPDCGPCPVARFVAVRVAEPATSTGAH